jgi:ABC-type nitrate/sulfonate/bicarbonate transport system substrate-binding protein
MSRNKNKNKNKGRKPPRVGAPPIEPDSGRFDASRAEASAVKRLVSDDGCADVDARALDDDRATTLSPAACPQPTDTDRDGSGAERLQPLEAAYSIVFLALLLWYTATGFADAQRFTGIDQRLPYVLFVVGVALQLLRMYKNLHTFEREIAKPSPPHFLELLNVDAASYERSLRGVLALTIVFSTKLGDVFFAHAPALRAPASVLVICFALLIFWDHIVWRGLTSAVGDRTDDEPALAAARHFFYVEEKTWPRSYFSVLKFAERFVGLLASVLLLIITFTSRPDPNQIGWTIVPLLVIVVIILYGHNRTGRRINGREAIMRTVTVPLIPIFTFVDFIREGSVADKRTRGDYWGYWLLLCGVLANLTVIACTKTPEQPTDTAAPPASSRQPIEAEPITVRIATSKNVWCALTLIARDQKLLEKEGLRPVFLFQAAGRLNMDAVAGGSADIANIVETNIAYQALSHQPSVSVFGIVSRSVDYSIVTKSAANIERAEQLAGKSIAYAQATGAESFLFWQLERAALSRTSVQLKPLQPAALVDYFAASDTDAVVTWEPFTSTVKKRTPSLGPTLDADWGGFVGFMAVAVRRDFVAQHDDVPARYARAMEAAATFARDKPKEARTIVAQQSGIPLPIVEAVWPRFRLAFEPASHDDARIVKDTIQRAKRYVPALANVEPSAVQDYFIFPADGPAAP